MCGHTDFVNQIGDLYLQIVFFQHVFVYSGLAQIKLVIDIVLCRTVSVHYLPNSFGKHFRIDRFDQIILCAQFDSALNHRILTYG